MADPRYRVDKDGPVSVLGGYRDHSEIVRAESVDPLGPYIFREVVLAGRGEEWWDGQMCHNPRIVQAGDEYVLYYIGRSTKSPERKIGYAVSNSVYGPWKTFGPAVVAHRRRQ